MMTMQMVIKDTAVVVGNSFSEALVADWLAFNADKKATTVLTYGKAIKNFFAWLSDNGIKNPCRDDVIRYRESLCSSKKIATARLYVSALKVFSKWLASIGVYPDFAAGVKTPKLDEEGETHSREALTLTEAHTVLNSFKGNDEKTLRDKCIVRILMNCGLRSCEVTRLDTTDFERRHGKIFLRVWGKARSAKVQRVEISQSVYNQLLEYLNCRGAKFKAGEAMFVSTANRNRGARLSTQSISKICKAIFRSVGIDSPTVVCHSLRHTAAQLMLDSGVSIEKIQKILRHKNSMTTRIYLRDRDEINNDGVQILSDLLDAAA